MDDRLQTAEGNALWRALQAALDTHFPAQERSLGFIVQSRAQWKSLDPKLRAIIILHEFYHQHAQIRGLFKGWSMLYWPAYMAVFPFTGWDGHWAEAKGAHAARAVDLGLQHWRPTDVNRE